MENYWSKYQESIQRTLASLVVTEAGGAVVESSAGFCRLCTWAREVKAGGNTIHFAGNGASACMASHMAVDWTKNAGVRAVAHNDAAQLTALGNDLGYDRAFAQPVLWHGRAGDLLTTISSSGNSPNVLRAIEAARERKMRVVTFSGMKLENKSRAAGDLNFYVSGWSYGIVECAHQILLHAWIDAYMEVKEWELKSPQVVEPPTSWGPI